MSRLRVSWYTRRSEKGRRVMCLTIPYEVKGKGPNEMRRARTAISNVAQERGWVPPCKFNGNGYWKSLRAWCESTGRAGYPSARRTSRG
jgi:hypothetical protein